MRGFFLALLAMWVIAGDSGRSPEQLVRNAAHAPTPYWLLWEASKQGEEDAEAALVELAAGANRQYWLRQLVSLGNADAAWALHELIDDEQVNSATLMRLAAKGNVPEAQLEYALSTDNPEQRVKWLKRAAAQAYLPAQISLADWYLLNQQYDQARPLLAITSQKDAQSAFQYGRLLWDEGDTDTGMQYLEKAAQEGHAQATAFVSLLGRFEPVSASQVEAVNWPSQCRQRIALFATSLSTLSRASELYTKFQKDTRLNTLPLCLSQPVWLNSDATTCTSTAEGANRLSCDITSLDKAVLSSGATHIVLVAEQGKASVENGVMYLDMTDTYSVFVHELAHFSGFADEYPMSVDVAERACSQQSAPNLVFDGTLTYRPVQRVTHWQTLSAGAGVWPSKSCEAIGIAAYKPSGSITFMEHHDSGEIPPLYLKLWRAQLLRPAAQRPVFMNLFQAFHKRGEQENAGIWLRKYNEFNRAQEPALQKVNAKED